MFDRREMLVLGAAALTAPTLALAQQAQRVRLRGTLESVSDTQLVLRQRNGERVELSIPPSVVVTEVYPVTLADVKPGTFIGVGGMPMDDGAQRAIAVTLFPEAMRGTGEGHYPFDFMPNSTMTNATVAEVAGAEAGSNKLRLRYPGGEQVIVVPPGTPIVSLRPADRSLLVVGAPVTVTAQEVQGKPAAVRVSAGRNGFAPPY
jgi:hypothetical protein